MKPTITIISVIVFVTMLVVPNVLAGELCPTPCPTKGCSVRVQVDDFEARVYKDAEGNTIPYRLFIPRSYDPKERYPLVLYMHGAAGRGDDNITQMCGCNAWGARVWAEEETQALYPSFVAVPQVPQDQRWADFVDISKPSTQSMRLTLEILVALQEEFSIDARRLYVTGQSLGGHGTWDVIARYPDVFAAAVPVAGLTDPSTAPLLVHMSIWAFHGALDGTVTESREMIEALREAGGEPLYTEYPDRGHDIWPLVYCDPDHLSWVFDQARPE